MTGPLSSSSEKTGKVLGFSRLLLSIAIGIFILLVGFFFWASQTEPYVKTTMSLQGSLERGSQLFRMNCAGCHGINAQGFVGPSLQKVSHRISDKEIIHQVINGRTPPMPSFEMEPEQMADLLEHLHSLN